MNLQPYVDNLRRELMLAAESGGEESRALAERLTAPLDSAVRLTLLDAISTAAEEISRDLAPGSVQVRLRGLDPAFVVVPPPDASFWDATEADPGSMMTGSAIPSPDGEQDASSRINLRLPESMKVRVEEAARREHLSINAWLIRAVVAALDGDGRGRRHPRGGFGGQRQTGWVR